MKKMMSAKELVCCGVCIALAFALSYVRIFSLPYSGSVTLCSMFFICYAGYCFGPTAGLICGAIYGLLQFWQGAYILNLLQLCCDYFLAFTALGLAGFFHKKGYKGMIVGYIIGVLFRGAFHTLGGYLFYMDYVPEEFIKKFKIVALYPIFYNYLYLLIEMAITLVILALPPVKQALERIRNMATE